MYILGLEEAWSRISWECGKWETQTPTYCHCTPQYYLLLSAGFNNFIPSSCSARLADWLVWWWDLWRTGAQELRRTALTLLSPGNPHLLPLNTSYTDISADKFDENNFYQLCSQFTKKGVGHCSVDSLIRLATLPPQVGTTRREEGEGAGAAGPEVKIIIIVQIIQM